MAIELRFPWTGPLGHVGFAYSPALEATLSLRPVLEPKRFPMYLPWARRTRDLSPALRSEIRALSFTFRDNVVGLFEVGLSGDFPTFEDELSAMASCDDDRVLYELAEPFRGDADGGQTGPGAVRDAAFQARVIDNARVADPTAADVLADAFDDPQAVRDRIVTMLRRYWEEAFREEWGRIRPRLEIEVGDMARALTGGGIAALVEEFLPEVRYEPSPPGIIVDRPYDTEIDVAARDGLVFVPYVYDFRIAVEMDPPWNLSIFVPVRDVRRPEVPRASDREVAAGLRALGDETRLQIMRLVAQSPRSTKELAELLSLSESAVSRHLKSLAGVGIVEGTRDGYYVLYALRPERIGALGTALRRTLGLAAPPSDGSPPRPVVAPGADRRHESTAGPGPAGP